MNPKAFDLIKLHEGFKEYTYTCPTGHLTVGYGYNLDVNPLNLSHNEIAKYKSFGISKQDADKLLKQMIANLESDLEQHLAWLSKLNAARHAVLIDMAYNLGIKGLLAFKNTLALLERGDYEAAAKEMLDSQWASQTKTRALRDSAIIRTGALKL